jgi:hypothetical protein
MARNARLADLAFLRSERCGARDLLLRSVIERDGKNALAARGTLDRVLDRIDDIGREGPVIADYL